MALLRLGFNTKPEDADGIGTIKPDRVAEMFEVLNRKFVDRPSGYVFRPPTSAEWEYAFKADDGENTDFRKFRFSDNNFWRTPEMEKYVDEHGIRYVEIHELNGGKGDVYVWGGSYKVYLPVHLSRANAWGLSAFGGYYGCALLDTVDHDKVHYYNNGKVTIDYVDGVELSAKDPVYISAGGRRISRAVRALMETITDADCVVGVRVVLGPDLLAEAKGGGGTSNGSAVAATGSKRLDRVRGDRPKDMSFKLSVKESLELVGIPSGSFMMGYEDTGVQLDRIHKVEITRPFWISKYPLTFGELQAVGFKGKVTYWFHERLKERGCYEARGAAAISGVEVDSFFKLLNEKFRNRPKGYLFRPPTMAEWQYVIKADKGNSTVGADFDPPDRFWDTREFVEYVKSKGVPSFSKWPYNLYVPVRFSKLNEWGVGAIGEFHGTYLLDFVNIDSICLRGGSKYYVDSIKGFDLSDRDPVLVWHGEGIHLEYVGPAQNQSGAGITKGGLGATRVVLGPDLLAEAKAAKK
jgi:formylglycine-generating enzyme required for sulfatase activity